MKKKARKEFGEAKRASVRKEMANPRVSEVRARRGNKSSRRSRRSA